MKGDSLGRLRGRFARLAAGPPPEPHCDTHRAAAVLVAVLPGAGSPRIILTRRTGHLPTHAGQISLPGGSREHHDQSLVQTALREAREEIGIDVMALEVLGCLEPTHLPSGFCVTPVVALAEGPVDLRPNPAEVEEIFTVPLPILLDQGLYRRGSHVRNGIKRDFYYFDYKEYYIWGATAKILRSLALTIGPTEKGPARSP